MSLCSVAANQPIYQALLDKAASYPADKPYQAAAYKKAAQIVATYPSNIYSEFAKYCAFEELPAGIGYRIGQFINEFIEANPKPAVPSNPMDAARVFAAASAPKMTTVWPNDASERAAFQQKVAVSKADDPAKFVELPSVHPALAPLRTTQRPNWSIYDYTPVTYTAENPRRSKRFVGKPKPVYFSKEDEEDEVAEAIEAVCAKKGYEYSDEFVAEFNTWLPTAKKWETEKYSLRTGKYEPRTKPEMAKEWAMYYSKSIQEQQKQKKSNKAIIKYCEKNNIEYQEAMTQKFAAWKADPANKKLVTYTYSSFSGCACGSCDPTGTKMANVTEYSYERTPAYCVKQWFSTLKKTVCF
jgi:hypothetical protein